MRERSPRFRAVYAATAGAASVALLATYTAQHLLHAAGLDPHLASSATSIPLFARVLSSAVCAVAVAVPTAAAASAWPGARDRLLAALPRLLAAATAAFALVIVAAP